MTSENQRLRCPVCEGAGKYKLNIGGLRDVKCQRCQGSGELLQAPIVVGSGDLLCRACGAPVSDVRNINRGILPLDDTDGNESTDGRLPCLQKSRRCKSRGGNAA